jgi:hypothetical protein
VSTPRVVLAAATNRPGGPSRGDVGVLLEASEPYARVLWQTGSAAGTEVPVYLDELEAEAGLLDDSLDTPMPGQVREALEHPGGLGVVAALEDAGELAGLAAVAEEAVEVVAGRCRHDLAATLARLDEAEAEQVVAQVTARLIGDCLEVPR